jgi:hypothetical protein
MSEELADLQRRVAALEREVAELRHANGAPTPDDDEPPDEISRQIPMLREAWKNRHKYAEGGRAFLRHLGIEHLKPVGAEKLQQMLIEAGHDPNSTEFSQGIIDMREE